MKDSNTKRLYRSEGNKVIAGVCGGIGDYFEIDPTIVRVVFILLTFFGPSLVVAYVLLWLLMPSESSSAVITDTMIKENIQDIKSTAEKTAENVTSEAKKAATKVGDTLKSKKAE